MATLDFCNAQWRAYTGLTQEELQGEGWQRMLHPDDRERVLKAWRESARSGTPYEQEERHRAADGQYRWFLALGVPLRDSAGRIVRWYGTNTDIEDRKRAEDELRKQKEIFQKIFEDIPAMIVFMGQDSHIELVNPEWERRIGWTLEEIRERNLDIYAELYPDPQYRQMVLDFVAVSTGEWTELKMRVRDGRVIDVAAARASFGRNEPWHRTRHHGAKAHRGGIAGRAGESRSRYTRGFDGRTGCSNCSRGQPAPCCDCHQRKFLLTRISWRKRAV